MPVDCSEGLRCNQTIHLTGPKPKKSYPKALRRVHLVDPEHNQNIILPTNITTCSAKQMGSTTKAAGRSNCYQAAFKNQSVLWTIAERSKNTNLVSYLQLLNHTNNLKYESF